MDAVNLIESIGYPITSAVVVGWVFWNILQRVLTNMETREARHHEHIEGFSAILKDFSESMVLFRENLNSLVSEVEDVKSEIKKVNEKLNK